MRISGTLTWLCIQWSVPLRACDRPTTWLRTYTTIVSELYVWFTRNNSCRRPVVSDKVAPCKSALTERTPSQLYEESVVCCVIWRTDMVRRKPVTWITSGWFVFEWFNSILGLMQCSHARSKMLRKQNRSITLLVYYEYNSIRPDLAQAEIYTVRGWSSHTTRRRLR